MKNLIVVGAHSHVVTTDAPTRDARLAIELATVGSILGLALVLRALAPLA